MASVVTATRAVVASRHGRFWRGRAATMGPP
jgi:hypothetical protein